MFEHRSEDFGFAALLDYKIKVFGTDFIGFIFSRGDKLKPLEWQHAEVLYGSLQKRRDADQFAAGIARDEYHQLAIFSENIPPRRQPIERKRNRVRGALNEQRVPLRLEPGKRFSR